MSIRLRKFGMSLALLLLVNLSASAQTFSWSGTGANGNWSNSANWSTAAPQGSGSATSIINFTTAGTNPLTIIDSGLGNPFVLNQLNASTNTAGAITVGGNALDFQGSGAQIANNGPNNSAGVLRINSAVNVGNGVTLNVLTSNSTSAAAGAEIILAGLLSGTGTVNISAGGISANALITAISNRNNAFAGTMNIISEGSLYLLASNALNRATSIVFNDTSAAPGLYTNSTDVAGNFTTGQAFSFKAASLNGTNTGASVNLGDPTAGVPSSALIGYASTTDLYAGKLTATTGSDFAKVGTGTMTLTGNSSASFRGILSVRDGSVILSGAGTVGATGNGATIYAGTLLSLDSSTTSNSNRIGTGSVRFAGGTLQLIALSTSTTLSEVIGSFILNSGQSKIDLSQGIAGGGGAITAGMRFSITTMTLNSPTATAFVKATGLTSTATNTTASTATGSITISTLPTLIGGAGAAGSTTLSVIPFLTGVADSSLAAIAPTGFLTYQGTGGTGGTNHIRLLNDATSEYSLVNPSGTSTTNNVSLASATTISAVTTVNALRLIAGGNVDNASTLTLTAGAFLNNGGGSITGAGTVSFGTAGANTAFITTNGDMGIANAISALNLSKNGAGNLTLTGATTLTGTTGNTVAVNAGTLTLGSTVATSVALSVNNSLIYQVSKGATLDVATNGLSVGAFTELRGSGTITSGTIANNKALTINGGTLTPSALAGSDTTLASPGTLAVNGDLLLTSGSIRWYVGSSLGGTGTTTDAYTVGKINVTGALSITGPITLKVTSLDLANTTPGTSSVYDFDSAATYSWILATHGPSGTVNSSNITIDTSNFNNGTTNNNLWSLTDNGTSLIVSYNTPVPEPTTILGITAAALVFTRCFRRRRMTVSNSA